MHPFKQIAWFPFLLSQGTLPNSSYSLQAENQLSEAVVFDIVLFPFYVFFYFLSMKEIIIY